MYTLRSVDHSSAKAKGRQTYVTRPPQLAASFISNRACNVGYWHLADNPVAPAFVRLQCQTSLTALTGVKGILPRCQTATTRKLNRAYARPRNVRYFPRKQPKPNPNIAQRATGRQRTQS